MQCAAEIPQTIRCAASPCAQLRHVLSFAMRSASPCAQLRHALSFATAAMCVAAMCRNSPQAPWVPTLPIMTGAQLAPRRIAYAIGTVSSFACGRTVSCERGMEGGGLSTPYGICSHPCTQSLVCDCVQLLLLSRFLTGVWSGVVLVRGGGALRLILHHHSIPVQ